MSVPFLTLADLARVGGSEERGERGGTWTGVGVTGASPRARDTEEARGDSLGAPRPPVMADLASPHGTLVGGHRRAACPDGTPRDVREAALSAPSFVQSPERRFHALAIITCYPYRDAVEINNQTR